MIQLYDNISSSCIVVDTTKRTADGYLAASARVARTGIQIYSGRECGRPEMDFVRVYRPEDEVFKMDALKSFAHRPITDDHPSTPVTADNWARLSKGHTADEVMRDGRFVRVPMLLMDGPTIKKWEDGKRELSMGYSCDLKWQDGATEDGQEYDAIQTNIRANHLALVKKARGGDQLRVGDEMKTCPECGHRMQDNMKYCSECGHEMVQPRKSKGSADSGSTADDLDNGTGNNGETFMRMTVDGITMDVADKDAQIIQRFLDKQAAEITTLGAQIKSAADEADKAKKKLETDAATLTTQVATLTTENTQLKTQIADAAMTPAKLDALVAQRSVTIEKAKAILGDKGFDASKTDAEIRRACVDKVVGAPAKDWSDELVSASFATIKVVGDGVKKLAQSFDGQPQPQPTQDAELEKIYQAREKRLMDAWKTPAAA